MTVIFSIMSYDTVCFLHIRLELLQEALLSQRDRATAVWVSFVPRCNWNRIFCTEPYRSIFNHLIRRPTGFLQCFDTVGLVI